MKELYVHRVGSFLSVQTELLKPNVLSVRVCLGGSVYECLSVLVWIRGCGGCVCVFVCRHMAEH